MYDHSSYTEPGIHRGADVGRLLAYIQARPIECRWKNCHRIVPLTQAIFGLCRLHAEHVEFLDVYAADVPAMTARMNAEAERELEDHEEKCSPTERSCRSTTPPPSRRRIQRCRCSGGSRTG